MKSWGDTKEVKGMNWSVPIFKDAKAKQIENIFLKALNTKTISPYKPEIRISKLPMCGLMHAMEMLKYAKGERKEEELKDSYYTNIGNAVHEFYQTLLPKSDVKNLVFGDWKCSDCAKIVYEKCTTPDSLICPHCKKNHETIKYEEISLIYRGITGHVDMIFKNEDGTYTLVDFKTTSAYSIAEPKYLPYPKHIMQIETYAFMLLHQFKIKISNYFIVYVSRDKNDGGKTLTNTRPIGADITKRILDRRQAQLDQIVYSRGLIKKLFKEPTVEVLKELDDNRPCHTVHDYENSKTGLTHGFFGSEECPFKDNCTNGKKKKFTQAARTLWTMIE